MTKYTVFFATCTPSMDTINVYLGLFSVHYQLKLISRPILVILKVTIYQ
jgi:hypothetical protein